MRLVARLQKPLTNEKVQRFLIDYANKYTIEEKSDALEAWEYTAKEKEEVRAKRIYEMSMTKSDFFDGTIKAFGLGKEELKQVIVQAMALMRMSELEQQIALNNYDNAKDFYRKHPLFDILSKIPLALGSVVIRITSEQWDEFFVRTNNRDATAYLALRPKV